MDWLGQGRSDDTWGRLLVVILLMCVYDLIWVSPDILRDGGRSPVRELRAWHWQTGLVIYWHARVIILDLQSTDSQERGPQKS